MYRMVVDWCIEKLHRVPEECEHIPMKRFWEGIALERERAEDIEKLNKE